MPDKRSARRLVPPPVNDRHLVILVGVAGGGVAGIGITITGRVIDAAAGDPAGSGLTRLAPVSSRLSAGTLSVMSNPHLDELLRLPVADRLAVIETFGRESQGQCRALPALGPTRSAPTWPSRSPQRGRTGGIAVDQLLHDESMMIRSALVSKSIGASARPARRLDVVEREVEW